MPPAAVGWNDQILASPAATCCSWGNERIAGVSLQRQHTDYPYTGLLAIQEVRSLAWDNHNHLYGLEPERRCRQLPTSSGLVRCRPIARLRSATSYGALE